MPARSRSRSPPRRAYSPSRAVERDYPPSPPRRYDERREIPPPRIRDEFDRFARDFDREVGDRRERWEDREPSKRYGAHERDHYRDDHRHDSHRRDDWSIQRRNGGREWDHDRHARPSAPAPPPAPVYDSGRTPSEPSRDIIFLGLDPQLSENDLSGYLRAEHGAQVESTKIVRDRTTGQSKGFGFAQFPTLEEAQRFMSLNFPNITMPALFAHSEPKRVKIDFAGSREHGPGALGVIPPTVSARHDGTRDIGQPGPNQRVLLLRGLDPGTYSGEVARRVGEEITRMLGRPGNGEACVTRVAIITDRSSGISWGFGFVELVTAELASALMPFLFSPQHQPGGFLINGVPIAASFANPGAFIPTPAGPLGGQFILRSAPDGGIGSATMSHPDGAWCAYWHQQAGAVETIPRGAPPIPEAGHHVEISEETRAFLGNLAGRKGPSAAASTSTGASAASTSLATAGDGIVPVSSVGPIKIGLGAGAKKKKSEEPVAMVTIMNKNILNDDDEVDLVGKDSILLSRTKGAHVIPPTSTSRKVMGNISKWNTKQTELAKPKPAKAKGGLPIGVSDANAAPLGAPAQPQAGPSQPQAPAPDPRPAAPAPPTSDEFDYGDTSNLASTGKVACLLCQRQFKSEEMLHKHFAQSDLHKTNLADPATRDAGKHRKSLAIAAQTGTDRSQYRDRAAERREVHHLPDRPALEPPAPRGVQPAQPPKPRAPSPPPAPGADTANVGNKLLSKMGWSSGTGLGASGVGRVEPIKVQQFEERAGLGAARGRDPGRWSGPGGFQQRAKDLTQQRFEESNKQQGQ